VDLRAILDAVVNRKIPSPRRESNPRTPIISIELIAQIIKPYVTYTQYQE